MGLVCVSNGALVWVCRIELQWQPNGCCTPAWPCTCIKSPFQAQHFWLDFCDLIPTWGSEGPGTVNLSKTISAISSRDTCRPKIWIPLYCCKEHAEVQHFMHVSRQSGAMYRLRLRYVDFRKLCFICRGQCKAEQFSRRSTYNKAFVFPFEWTEHLAGVVCLRLTWMLRLGPSTAVFFDV
jgi:hypothetical protein